MEVDHLPFTRCQRASSNRKMNKGERNAAKMANREGNEKVIEEGNDTDDGSLNETVIAGSHNQIINEESRKKR